MLSTYTYAHTMYNFLILKIKIFWIFFRYTNAHAENVSEKCRRMIWALVVLWWLYLNPTGLLSPKLSPV